MNPTDGCISIIIPVLNAADCIEEQLRALAGQTYGGDWELVVADNGSTDGTRDIVESWRRRMPNMIVVDANRPGQAAARNLAVKAAQGDRLAFCDADDIVSPGWLAACAAAGAEHQLVAGAIEHVAPDGSPIPWKADAKRKATTALYSVPFAMGANMTVSRQAFESVGGFAEDLACGEDIDLSWRLQQGGYRLFFEPGAVVTKRSRQSLREEWRQALRWGVADVELERRHRGTGLARPSITGAMRYVLGRAVRDPRLAASLLRFRNRRFWVAGIARRWGRLRGSVRAS
jgi:glycosyltransferase involved in cell wall biosynthesis